MTDRINHLFSENKAKNKASFIGYVCAGDPDKKTCLDVCKALLENGVELLELGIPFSDPLADGLTNQLAAQRALQAGAKLEDTFDLIRSIRSFSEAPIVLYCYYNAIFSQSVESFVVRAREAGVDGILALDLPPEEAGELVEASKKHNMKNIFIVAPTTPEDRIHKMAESASGFIYYVSREGVTGERSTLATNTGEAVNLIKSKTDLPVAVGFGISTADHVRETASYADGVIVGSALVNCIAKNLGNPAEIVRVIGNKAKDLSKGLES